MFTFTICFVVKSILLLIAAFTEGFYLPVIVFALLEQIPTAGMGRREGREGVGRSGKEGKEWKRSGKEWEGVVRSGKEW
jgi:hypothetical protein